MEVLESRMAELQCMPANREYKRVSAPTGEQTPVKRSKCFMRTSKDFWIFFPPCGCAGPALTQWPWVKWNERHFWAEANLTKRSKKYVNKTGTRETLHVSNTNIMPAIKSSCLNDLPVLIQATPLHEHFFEFYKTIQLTSCSVNLYLSVIFFMFKWIFIIASHTIFRNYLWSA